MPKLTKGAPKAAKRARMAEEMGKYKSGELKIGKSDKPVTSRKQAIAISLSESGQSKKSRGKRVGRK